MFYKPLHETLVALNAQQRQELAALSGCMDAAQLRRARNAKKKLYAASVFFIEQTWEILAPQLEAFSLEGETGKSSEELRAHLQTLGKRKSAYAWGWIRARMNAWLMGGLEACVPDILAQHPQQAALYGQCLRKVDAYWIRETPLHHLKAGYHTALGVACKWYGSAFELQPAAPYSCPRATRCFPNELRRFASFSLNMLIRTDGYLWDSAGAQPLDAVIEGGTLKIAPKVIEELSLQNAPDYGLRLGCPALQARCETGTPAFAGIVVWVEQVFSHYLLEPLN